VVEEGPDGAPLFAISGTGGVRNTRLQEEFIEVVLRYVPRSKQLGPDIPSQREEKLEALRWWNPPDEKSQYAYETLARDITTACESYYRRRSVIPGYNEVGGRNEILQRSWLTDNPRFLGASIIDVSRPELNSWIVHRCYLYYPISSNASDPKISVYRYPRGPLQDGYTQYLRSIQAMPGVLNGLYAVSCKV
jgi:hypothetical protein